MIDKFYLKTLDFSPDMDEMCKKINELINILNENETFRNFQNERIKKLEQRIHDIDEEKRKQRYLRQ